MKNKGFTLVELLAIIVILAIITLIATPIILGVIRDSKQESDERSIDLYAVAIRNAMSTYEMKEERTPKTIDEVEEYISYDGAEVECSVRKINPDGSIYLTGCKVNGQEIDYEYGISSIPVQKGKFTSVCKPADGANNYSTNPGTKYNCKVDPNKDEYTFYVLNSDTESVNLIMSHNINSDGTIATVEGGKIKKDGDNVYNVVFWCNDLQSCNAPLTSMDYLDEATKNWTNLDEMTIDSFEYYANGNFETKSMKPYNTYARMPYYNEVSTYDGTNEYLYDNLFIGYWTMAYYDQANSSASDFAWFINYAEYTVSKTLLVNYYTGVRPVITLSI